MGRVKNPRIPARLVHFKCSNADCEFIGCGVVDRPYIRCTRCNRWSSIFKAAISKEEYDAKWGKR
jgi:hypothetical protein